MYSLHSDDSRIRAVTPRNNGSIGFLLKIGVLGCILFGCTESLQRPWLFFTPDGLEALRARAETHPVALDIVARARELGAQGIRNRRQTSGESRFLMEEKFPNLFSIRAPRVYIILVRRVLQCFPEWSCSSYYH